MKTTNDSTENRAVIYVRVSTKDQVENFSLATQEKACGDYCAKFGMKVDQIFVEEGESAKTVNRVQFQKALAYCRENKGRVKWLVVSVLNFAEHIILNASRLWTEASSDQKERLQKVFFPKGVTFADGSYGTSETCPFFNLIPRNEAEKNGMATLPGIEPGLPP